MIQGITNFFGGVVDDAKQFGNGLYQMGAGTKDVAMGVYDATKGVTRAGGGAADVIGSGIGKLALGGLATAMAPVLGPLAGTVASLATPLVGYAAKKSIQGAKNLFSNIFSRKKPPHKVSRIKRGNGKLNKKKQQVVITVNPQNQTQDIKKIAISQAPPIQQIQQMEVQT